MRTCTIGVVVNFDQQPETSADRNILTVFLAAMFRVRLVCSCPRTYFNNMRLF